LPDISVVVPVRNGEQHLPALLAALAAQTLDTQRYEVLVVDNNSDDRTPELLDEWSAEGTNRRVLRATGQGPAHARNVGVRAARGSWIAFTDADTIPDAGWLEALASAAAANGTHAFEGAVISSPNAALGSNAHHVSNETGGKFITANMTYRRDVLEQLGGFDEQFEQPFLEDSDLAFRTLDAGYDISFCGAAVVQHPPVQRTALATLKSADRTVWFALFAAKHPRRYRTQLRPVVRPLTTIDLDVLSGLAAAAAATRASGFPRLVLLALAANGLKRGVVPAVRGVPQEQKPAAAAVAVAGPPLRAFWWLVGCVRFRKAVW
jgi:glycosyltransferase involved in cell wall biosynthesis